MANRNPVWEELIGPNGVVTRSAGETARLGAALAENLDADSVLSLEGPLGAGKTQFARGLAGALGCDASSPSFAIVHEYSGGRLPVFHFDFYRMEAESELLTAGYDDSLGEGVVIVEWGDKFPGALPPGTLRLAFELRPDGARRIRGGVKQ